MLPQQKEAVLTLVVWGIGIVLMFAIMMLHPGYQTEIIYALLALTIVAMWVCRRISGVKWKNLDERDQGFRFKAGMVTLVVVACVLISGIYHQQGVVPIVFLARMAFGAMASLYLFWTVAILVLYRKGG